MDVHANTQTLRLTNGALVLPCLALTIYRVALLLGHGHNCSHAVLNISSFPLIFFFSGLYYTDVASVLMVLVTYEAFLRKQRLAVFFLSASSLWFRQTNIFWVSISLGGLEVVRSLPTSSLEHGFSNGLSTTAADRQLYTYGHIYDAAIDDAQLEDYVVSAVSMVAASLADSKVIMALQPYLATLVLFAAFVIWNGGVVLGKKACAPTVPSYADRRLQVTKKITSHRCT